MYTVYWMTEYKRYVSEDPLRIIKDMETFYNTSEKLHVVIEFCPGGNLRNSLLNSRVYPSPKNSSNYINMTSTLNHRQLLKIAVDISNGMAHISSQKVYLVVFLMCLIMHETKFSNQFLFIKLFGYLCKTFL